MILPWRVHVLSNDVDIFLKTIPRIWDSSTCDIFHSDLKNRKLVVCYAVEDEKTFLKIKFDLIEDVRNKEK